jgi:hypothetical protein
MKMAPVKGPISLVPVVVMMVMMVVVVFASAGQGWGDNCEGEHRGENIGE